MRPTDVARLVEKELASIADAGLVQRARELLVVPYSVTRDWNYGESDEAYVCWTVLENPKHNIGIAYCEQGFGPIHPWGLVFLSGPHMDMGMDSEWFGSFERALRDSRTWITP